VDILVDLSIKVLARGVLHVHLGAHKNGVFFGTVGVHRWVDEAHNSTTAILVAIDTFAAAGAAV